MSDAENLWRSLQRCESAPNTDPRADCHQVHDFADEFIASAGSPSAPIVTPSDFHFASLNPGFALPLRGVSSSVPIHRVDPNDAKTAGEICLQSAAVACRAVSSYASE